MFGLDVTVIAVLGSIVTAVCMAVGLVADVFGIRSHLTGRTETATRVVPVASNGLAGTTAAVATAAGIEVLLRHGRDPYDPQGLPALPDHGDIDLPDGEQLIDAMDMLIDLGDVT